VKKQQNPPLDHYVSESKPMIHRSLLNG
jgi:hypothetical protein